MFIFVSTPRLALLPPIPPMGTVSYFLMEWCLDQMLTGHFSRLLGSELCEAVPSWPLCCNTYNSMHQPRRVSELLVADPCCRGLRHFLSCRWGHIQWRFRRETFWKTLTSNPVKETGIQCREQRWWLGWNLGRVQRAILIQAICRI